MGKKHDTNRPSLQMMVSGMLPVVSWLGLLTICLAAETCYEGPSGASLTDGRAGGHNIQVTKAMISKPAPAFSGTAVLNGEFTELKLEDYLGKYLVFFFYPLRGRARQAGYSAPI